MTLLQFYVVKNGGQDMINYAAQINNAIDVAFERTDFQQRGLSRFEKYNQNRLNNALQTANITFTSSVSGMNSMSHLIEDQVAEMYTPFQFYSAFQKISRIWPQEQRYRRILATGNPVYAFGLPDSKVWDDANLHFVSLEAPGKPLPGPASAEGSPSVFYRLDRHWFVIVHNPRQVSMALVAREMAASQRTSEDKLLKRHFEGFWSYDIELVKELSALLDQYVLDTQQTQ